MAGQPYSKADQLARAPRPEPKKKWPKPLPWKSPRREAMAPERKKLVDQYRAEDDRCHICDIIVEADPGWVGRHGHLDPVLGRVRPHSMDDLHELRKRSDTGSLFNPDNLIRACNPGNFWVENNPADAHLLHLVVRRGDEGWVELGADHDPPRPS